MMNPIAFSKNLKGNSLLVVRKDYGVTEKKSLLDEIFYQVTVEGSNGRKIYNREFDDFETAKCIGEYALHKAAMYS